jgi:glycosyltransferase involved in cell wall biosynthesis
MLAPRTIHLVNPMWNAAGGSELHTLALYHELRPYADVRLWSDGEPAPAFVGVPIERIEAGHFPRGGTLVFVGVYRLPGDWIAQARARRVIVLYNMLLPGKLVAFMKRLFAAAAKEVEIVYVSELLKQKTKLRGIVEPSLIDLARFAPRPRIARETFVVGRLSRDDYRKHHADDRKLYQRLSEHGCLVRVMGGTCISAAYEEGEAIELLPALAEPAEEFLQTLDCFVYRTRTGFWEAFGRVVHEAMACGLPVVCGRDGGYATSIEHGRNGFLFDSNEEAVAIIDRLRREPERARQIGREARAAVEALYAPEERAKVIDYFLL